LNQVTAKTTVKNADQVIAFINGKLSEVSYLGVDNGYVKVRLDFDNAVSILTLEVRNLVIRHFQDDYSDVSIIFEGGVKVLKMKSPMNDYMND
jgi:hypothetical protein